MATVCTEAAGVRFPDRSDARNSQEFVNEVSSAGRSSPGVVLALLYSPAAQT
jgi:hypothetical protein